MTWPVDNSQIRILIIDDEEIMRCFLSDIFKDMGYQVEMAGCGEEGVSLFKQRPFQVVISDIKMPGMSGVDVLEQIMALENTTKVILITGYASVDSADRSVKLGASEYITKPFEMDHIRSVVQNIINAERAL